MGTRFIFSLLLGYMLFYSQFVAAWEVSCPKFINIKSSTTVLESDVPASWQGSSRYEPRLWLDGVGMSQGKPENRIDLKPETEKIKGETRQIWDTTMTTNQDSERYWVSCIYNHGQVWLSQPVPASATQCQASSLQRQREQGESLISVICK
ncbi:STY0301 family protein [Escherichia marmotae]|uniref:STY0301 family protein n=1 Tax=Escherichia TaxID=561 RepID=UPI000A1876B9|nr:MULTISPECIES: STY0301 family protein [Escherichia]MDZ5521058.1 STY0301 family protein [Escherichia marmotae]MEC9617096.1 STY0301 family protein [Escherichia marmotae]MED0194417.1 STY0301 family protein [Escherichia marmotae]MED0231274.1 STY0301 family protein [Escherichia marmotae]MED0238550.1 STY0301 family protein [Escherichia marmotae]